MNMVRALVVAVVVVTTLAGPARALAASDISLEAELANWGGAERPAVLLVTASSDVLLSGHLKIRLGSLNLFEAVELPAGTEKAWEVKLPAPGSASQVVLSLANQDGETVSTMRLTLPSGDGGPRVAAVRPSRELLDTLRSARSAPTGQALEIEVLDDVEGIEGYSYLVLGEPLGTTDLSRVLEWVESGGRLVAATDILGSAWSEAASSPWGPVRIVERGFGEIISIDPAAASEGSPWGVALRDRPGGESAGNFEGEFGGDPYRSLGEAASGTSDALALIPWLLPALAGYVLIVGPINLIVLRRLGKAHFGWLTVPAMAFLGVTMLWYFGPRQSNVVLQHASIVVTGEDTHSGIALVASNDGRREFEMEGADVMASLTTTGIPFEPAGAGLAANLATGRTVTLYTRQPSPEEGFDVTVDGDVVTLTNRTEVTFEQWGIAAGELVVSSSGELAPGESDELRLVGLPTGDPWEPILMQALWEQNQFQRSELLWRAYRPLLVAGEGLVAGMRTESFAWGLTSSEDRNVIVDGRPRRAEGITLHLDAVSVPPKLTGSGMGRILESSGLQQEGPFFLWGAGSVTVQFTIPSDATALRLVDRFGGLGRSLQYSLYDPTIQGWALIGESGLEADADPFVTPDGSVYVLIETSQEREIDLQSLQMEVTR